MPFRNTRVILTSAFMLCVLFCCTFLLSLRLVQAQTVTGNITGTVTDASGAVIPNATVTAHNIRTDVKNAVTTNAAGVYTIRFLPIGQYDVTIQASGFSAQTLPPFTLEIDQTVKFDAHLQVGSTTQTVQVNSTAPVLNTTDSSLGVTMSANEINTIPLNGRNFSSVTLFVPGSISTQPSGMTGNNAIERSTYYTDIPNINGNRAQANNYTLDGIDLNETENNLIAYNVAPDAIQELKVISANAPAEYGNVNGGDVVSVLKSGTNQFHGSAYAYLQNENMDANSWYNDHQTPHIPISPYTQTQFGGTLGGPVLHNKLFFFADYEGVREHTGGTGTATVFTSAMRTGDFSILLNPPTSPSGSTNAAIQLYNTQNNFVPYKNNQISIVNPVAKFLFAHPDLYPLPNATPSDGVANANFHGPNRSFTVNNQGDIKIEWDPRNADKITGFYSQSNAFDGNVPVLLISFPAQNNFPSKLGGAMWVHIFSPAIVNSARVGFTRVVWDQSVPTDPSGQFGLTGNSIVGIPFGAQQYVGFSNQGINGFSNVGTTANVGSITDNTYNYGDNLTWQHGLHLISLGIEALRYQNNFITSNNQGFLGNFNYSGSFTSNPSPAAPNGLGYGGADFALDLVTSNAVEEGGILVGQRQWRIAGFAQDDWKVLPNLTLNLGLRYEYDQPWYEVNNKTGNVLLSTGQFIYAHSVPAGAPAGSGVCSNRACYNPTYDQFMPRIGFAFQATNRFVVRGGYGATSFFEGSAGNQRLASIPPFVQSSFNNAITPALNSDGTLSSGTPFTVEDGFNGSPSYSAGSSGFGAWPLNMKPAYIQEWSLTTEYAINGATSLQVGYLGEQGQHLIDYRNGNQYLVNGDPSTGPLNNAVGSQGVLLVTEPDAMMNYNALQATLRHRASHGLEYTVNYAYGRAMTNSLGNYTLNASGYDSGAYQNAYDSHADYGPAGYDVRHNLSGIGVYELPFGRGKEFGSGMNHFADLLVGGWSLSGSVIAYSGFPITITAPNVSNSNNVYSQSRANQYRKMKIAHRSILNWFGTDPSATPCSTGQGVNNGVCAYGTPAGNTFGNARVGTERAPGYWQIDNSLFKDFHITERQAIGFRADAFNTFNIASYGNPDSGITDSTFGHIADQGSPTRSPARVIQLNLHYSF